MKYGICYCYWSKDWEGKDYPNKIERARRCGFDVLEIFYGRVMEMAQQEIEEIKAASRANDIELYCCGGFGKEQDISSLDETTRKNAIEHAKSIVAAISKIGARNFSGINYSAWCDFDHPELKKERTDCAAKSLKEIAKVAEDFGMSWNMEVINRFEGFLLNTAKEAKALADAVDSKSINILLDVFHGMLEEDDLAQAVRTAGNRLGHYHVGANNRKLPMPGSFLPFGEIGEALSEIGYDKCVSFEPLVHQGGTVALNGGSVWREMLPENITDTSLDDMLRQSLAFIKEQFEK